MQIHGSIWHSLVSNSHFKGGGGRKEEEGECTFFLLALNLVLHKSKGLGKSAKFRARRGFQRP